VERYGTHYEHIGQFFGNYPLLASQCIFLQYRISRNELKDLFLEHHMRFEGSEVGIPSCWNAAGKCALLGFVRVDESLEFKLEML